MTNTPASYFSIVIPTLNEEKYLPELLKDLSQQSFKDFEVIVVDGHSEDKTQQKAENFSKKIQITVIPVSKRNVSFQRNTGSSQAKSHWVLFMDADNRLPKYFLEGVRYQLIKNPSTDIFTNWLSVEKTSRMDKLIENAINLDIELYNIIGKTKGIGALLGIKKSILKKYHFDETQNFLEDGMLVKAICDAGYTFKIFRDPKFIYSLRRIKKEGNFKMLQAMIKYQFHYLKGGDFSKPFSAESYPMLGGTYYETADEKTKHWYSSMQNFITTASKKQLEQARHILNMIKEM
jgi:glycosyltransferase involved in cell wall biosynthesis